MFTPKIIKTEAEYEETLEAIEGLMGSAPPGSPEAEQLELLVHLVKEYEDKAHPVPSADPITVIKHVMEERKLSQTDMAPYFGSKSRASEVLSGKRLLTLKMIRALHHGLAIPAEALLGEGNSLPEQEVEDGAWPIKEIIKNLPFLGRFDLRSQAEEIIQELKAKAGISLEALAPAFRGGQWNGRDGDALASKAWLLVAAVKANETIARLTPREYDPSTLPKDFLKRVAQYSISPDFPRQIANFLGLYGIIFIYLPPFTKTYLEGAAFFIGGTPVVVVTARRNRLDSFFFTLLHEISHIVREHVRPGGSPIIDESIETGNGVDESVANMDSAEAIVPREYVESHPAFGPRPSFANVEDLARRLGIHPILVAGRVQREKQNFKSFAKLVGQVDVRRHIEEQSTGA